MSALHHFETKYPEVIQFKIDDDKLCNESKIRFNFWGANNNKKRARKIETRRDLGGFELPPHLVNKLKKRHKSLLKL
jgi:hypothetical protein